VKVTNAAVGRVFYLIADLLELKGGEEAPKAAAYRRAARSVEAFPEAVTRLHEEGRLREIPGVGEALARKIGELIDTGRLRYLERLTAEVPPGVLELLRVPGVGVKTAGTLWRELGITSVDELERACRTGALQRLPGLGPRKEQAILEGIASYRREADRHPLGSVRPVGEALVSELGALPGVTEVSLAGSVRRWRDRVGDLDLVVAATDPAGVAEALARMPEVVGIRERSLEEGPGGVWGRVGFTLPYGIAVDVRLVPPAYYGAALVWHTGSRSHVQALAGRAAALGLELSERGLSRAGQGPGPAPSEKDVYQALGLEFVPPELREDGGEIEVAAGLTGESFGPPRLLERRDIRGDLHVHSDWSDGAASLEDLAAAGTRLGYEYLAVSDHTKSLSVAGGLDDKRVREQIEAIARLNAKAEPGRCRLLAGVEVDILAGGELDLPDGVLAELDLVIASVHSRLARPGAETTERLLKAAENENVDILGHPTGRLIGQRGPSELDLEAVFKVAAANGTMLEINASPERLDLGDEDCRRAKEAGCRLVVGTDAHNLRALEDMAYGVAVARRARLGPDDVANSRPWSELRRLLKH